VDDSIDRVSALLREAAETHHRVYRIVDGDDPDWATWYADWLVRLSELSRILGRELVRSELTYQLVKLDRDFNSVRTDEAWDRFYARGLVEQPQPALPKG
jgi:hypothetical protein